MMDYYGDREYEEIMAIKQREESLRKLMVETGCEIVQENGQRKLGGPPPNWKGPPPPKGCEVFVGRIPRDVFEDELFRVFSTVGTIYELRLMMDFSGANRGFGFVQYAHRQDAERAVAELNNFELRPKHKIGVVRSIDNCRLFIGGIPKNKNHQELQAEMERLTEGVAKVIVYSNIADKSKNRGFAFVEYVNHRAASKARRKLIPNRIQLWGSEIEVDWAAPENEIDDDVMSKVTNIYVRNLSLTTTEQYLRDIFNKVTDDDVQRVKMMRDFAFIHFTSRESAEKAIQAFNGTEINGSKVEVTWAKPQKDKKSTKSRPSSRKTSSVSVCSMSSLNSHQPAAKRPSLPDGFLSSMRSSQQNDFPGLVPQRCAIQQSLMNPPPSFYNAPPPVHANATRFQSDPPRMVCNPSHPFSSPSFVPGSIDLNGNNYCPPSPNVEPTNRVRKMGTQMFYGNFGPPLHFQPNWMAEERSRAGTSAANQFATSMDSFNEQFNKMSFNHFNHQVGPLNNNVALNPNQLVNPFIGRSHLMM